MLFVIINNLNFVLCIFFLLLFCILYIVLIKNVPYLFFIFLFPPWGEYPVLNKCHCMLYMCYSLNKVEFEFEFRLHRRVVAVLGQ